ncbi:MnhB domain-containing protein [Ilumatobacter sp.]|uniref:MnhB domain-containing protein n=1 Tax=Ilumatobacter sp. TaxID=1967498 RepID=UPI003C584821
MIAERSLVVRDGIRLASPLAAVVGVMLFFAGHNQAGGGFAAGLVFGSICALRSVVGLSIPRHPLRLMAIGGAIIGLVAIAPIVAGDVALDQYIWQHTFPVLGKVKVGSALFFDLGVTVIVLGLVTAVLEGLGADELRGTDGSVTSAVDGGGES